MTTHLHRRPVRLNPVARVVPFAAVMLLATACGSTTTSPTDAQPAAPATTALDEPVASTPVTSTPVASTPAPSTPVASTPAPSTPFSCGDFGPIPPRPDSMPTLLYDTDGDGNIDDEVTAYGGIDGWVVRVVENGVVSEALTPGIEGWAFISNNGPVNDQDHIEVTDKDAGTIFTLATVNGCVELLDTRDPSQGLVAAPECTTVDPIPASATTVSDLTLDVTGDGITDDQIVTYFDNSGTGSNWFIRATVDGVSSEVGVTGVGAGSLRALGAVDVGVLSAGNEIIAATGAGASASVIGVFGVDGFGCISAFSGPSGDPLAITAGASIGSGSTFSCGVGSIGVSTWNLEADDNYTMYSSVVVESSLGQFTDLPDSGDMSEALSADDLPTALFDCAGLTL